MEEQGQLPGIQKEKRKRKSRQYYLAGVDQVAGTAHLIGDANPSEAACIATAPGDGEYLILVKSRAVTIKTVAKKEVKTRG